MDLSVLHPVKSPDRDYRWKDKLNSITGPLGCRFLEWSGWYNQDISQRLLGHYRLYQLFKAKNKVVSQLSLPLAYTMHYRTLHRLKYGLSCITAVLYYIFTLGDRYYPLQVEELNKQLIHHRQSILQEFLTNAEVDFEKALFDAIDQINGSSKDEYSNTIVVQNRLDYKVYNSTCHYFTEYNTAVHPVTNTFNGKPKGVFSKKQILIFFDLLTEIGSLEKIDYTKHNKFEALGEMLQAVTGKSKESWIEELTRFKSKGLYDYRDEGELKQLKIILTNLSEIFRKAGFRKISKYSDSIIFRLDKNSNQQD